MLKAILTMLVLTWSASAALSADDEKKDAFLALLGEIPPRDGVRFMITATVDEGTDRAG